MRIHFKPVDLLCMVSAIATQYQKPASMILAYRGRMALAILR